MSRSEVLERRQFLGTCAALSGAGGCRHCRRGRTPQPRFYERTALVDAYRAPLRVRDLKDETNYVFQYPYAARRAFFSSSAARRNGGHAQARGRLDVRVAGGVGPRDAIVAFSAICAHKLAYPTRDVSFIRYQRQPSSNSVAQAIHCCAEHSVYDPASGARVVSGPAPQPLAAILLEYDAAQDTLAAVGTLGAEQFDAFFRKYEFKLAMDTARARRAVRSGHDGRQGARAVLPPDDPVLIERTDSAIVVTDLAKSYGAVEAVKGISFAVRTGTTTALLGGNGAGKTTTLSMLLGVLTPSAGRVTVLARTCRRNASRAPADELHVAVRRFAEAADRRAEPLRVCRPLRTAPRARANRRSRRDCDLTGLLKRRTAACRQASGRASRSRRPC
jgi:Rieske Fe-S protein